jgi:hypothetical protein
MPVFDYMDQVALHIAIRELVWTTIGKLGEPRHRAEIGFLGLFREAANKHIVGHLGA